MKLTNLDLNLLLPLDALLHERSVTRAAERLGLSQPSLSAALGRLRRHFGDDLLVRVGNRYDLTPLGSRLLENTAFALSGVDRVFGAQAETDPLSCTRTFTVSASDYGVEIFAPALVDALASRAPRARVRFQPHTPAAVADAANHLRTTDSLMLPHGLVSGLPYLDLYEDRWVVIANESNESITGELTLDHLRTLPWVVSHHEPVAYTPAGRQLKLLGIEPDVRVVVFGFLPLARLVRDSQRIAVMPARLAVRLPRQDGFAIHECPFDAVPLVDALWWHPGVDGDPEHRMFRQAAADAAASLAPAPTAASTAVATAVAAPALVTAAAHTKV